MLDIRQFGAVPDGTTINTRAIQEAQQGALSVIITHCRPMG